MDTIEPLCPGLVDDAFGKILNGADGRTVGRFMLTCKRAAAAPARVMPLLQSIRSFPFSGDLFPSSLLSHVFTLKRLEISDFLGIRMESKKITAPIAAEEVEWYIETASDTDKVFGYLQKTQKLIVHCSMEVMQKVTNSFVKHQWNDLENLTVRHSHPNGDSPKITVPALNLPKLRRLEIECLCGFPIHTQPIWQQLKEWEVRHGCDRCLAEFQKLDVSNLDLSMENDFCWDEFTPIQLSQLSPKALQAYQNAVTYKRFRTFFHQEFGWFELVKKVQSAVNWPLTVELSALGLRTFRFYGNEKETPFYLDMCCKVDSLPERLHFDPDWLTQLEWKREWVIKVLETPAWLGRLLTLSNTRCLDKLYDLTKAHKVDEPHVQWCFRMALQKSSQIYPEPVRWLHSTLNIHDWCGILYKQEWNKLVYKAGKDGMWRLQLQIPGRVEFGTDFGTHLGHKINEFIRTTLKEKLQPYFCEFCTTCKYL